MFRPLLASAFAVLTLAACGGPVEDTRPGQPVKHRQEAFKAMLRTFEPMGTMLRDDKYQADRFAALATELVALRDAPWRYFEADTLYPPSKATASVWSDAAGFEAERMKFFELTDALAAAARTRDKAQVQEAYARVYDSCKSCHRGFKN